MHASSSRSVSIWLVEKGGSAQHGPVGSALRLPPVRGNRDSTVGRFCTDPKKKKGFRYTYIVIYYTVRRFHTYLRRVTLTKDSGFIGHARPLPKLVLCIYAFLTSKGAIEIVVFWRVSDRDKCLMRKPSSRRREKRDNLNDRKTKRQNKVSDARVYVYP